MIIGASLSEGDMKSARLVLAMIAVSSVLTGSISARGMAQVVTIDGVVHVRNPETPLKGTVKLEAQKVLTINPYDRPDVGFSAFSFQRGTDGEVMLYSDTELHRFGPKGEYRGRLSREGQGPGEFGQWSGALPFFLDDGIWVSSGQKLAEFDRTGKLVSERTLKIRPSFLIDKTRFLAERRDRSPDGSSEGKALVLVRFGKESLADVQEVEFLKGDNLGSIRNKGGKGGLTDPWGTPNLCFGCNVSSGRVYAAINTEYKILVKDLKGNMLLVIEKAHVRPKVDRGDIELMIGSFVKSEAGKWILDAYPDRYVAMNLIQPLANGFFLVRRVTGPKQSVIDVFGPDGRFFYVLLPPEGMTFDPLTFHARGFSRTAKIDDFPVYEDYRITNLPEIFGK